MKMHAIHIDIDVNILDKELSSILTITNYHL